jgi:hypothetical protein
MTWRYWIRHDSKALLPRWPARLPSATITPPWTPASQQPSSHRASSHPAPKTPGPALAQGLGGSPRRVDVPVGAEGQPAATQGDILPVARMSAAEILGRVDEPAGGAGGSGGLRHCGSNRSISGIFDERRSQWCRAAPRESGLHFQLEHRSTPALPIGWRKGPLPVSLCSCPRASNRSARFRRANL